MDPNALRKWLDARRGRLSNLARAVDKDRQFVWQWSRGVRPIPANLLPIVVHEMRKVEQSEMPLAA
jgi:hypothetical protein